jgi:diguanylate cyclase (GGDEF)-like protein
MAALMWGALSSHTLIAWWLSLWLVDMATVVHTTRYLRQSRAARERQRWLQRQLGLQTLAGVVWGSILPVVGMTGNLLLESDVGMVLMTVNAIAVIGLLPYRRAVLGWTLGVWSVPLLYLMLSPSGRHLQLLAGILVLVISLNFYLWQASGQLVDGLEKRFRADALADALRSATDRIRELATRDELTGVFNRRHGMGMLQAWRGAVRGRREQDGAGELAVLLIDIDWFKRVNDSHGHPVGDAVLRVVSQRLQATLRGSDLLARIGGEEFMVALPHTSLAAAQELAERLRQAVANEPVVHEPLQLPVSISVGVAMLGPQEGIEALLARADAALYQAKHQGRNRVVCAGGPTPLTAPAAAG